MENDVRDKTEKENTYLGNMTSKRPMSLPGIKEVDNMSKDIFHTPLNTQQLRSKNGTLRSIDSGFSERSANSLFGDETPALSASSQSSPEDREAGCTKDLVPDNTYSPTSHLPSVAVRARRLRFHPFDMRPPPFKLSPDDVDSAGGKLLNKGADSFTSKSQLQTTEVATACTSQDDSALNTPERSSSSSLSGSTDDLEISLQEMSLDELSSSSCASPLFRSSPINHLKGDINNESCEPFQRTTEADGQKTPDAEFDVHPSGSYTVTSPPTQNTLSPDKSELKCLNNNPKVSVHDQHEFLKSLSLTLKAHQEASYSVSPPTEYGEIQSHDDTLRNEPVTSPSTSGIKCNISHSPQRKSGAVACTCQKTSLKNSRVPPLPHEYEISECPVHTGNTHRTSTPRDASIFVQNCGEHPDFLSRCDRFPASSQELLKSPSKRNSCKSSPYKIRSPSKARKSLYSPTKRILKSPSKKARDNNKSSEVGDATTVIRSIFCDKHTTPDYRSPSFMSQELPQTSCDREEVSVDIGVRTNSEDVKESVQTLNPVSIFHEPVKDFSEEAQPSNDLSSEASVKLQDPESGLVRVLKLFSPQVPSRLIGRHTGVHKFDIVAELSAKSFLHCVQRILSHLSVQDLGRVCQVSKAWKSVVFTDPLAVCRYKLHATLLRRQAVLLGKENTQEKSLESTAPAVLTASKGHLTSVQPQATPRNHLAQVDTKPCVDLLSDDRLRCCPQCQAPAKEVTCQDRAVCSSETCAYDFCTLCFSAFHKTRRCKPLSLAVSKNDVAGTRKSKKNLRRL